jgi:hypothetical protein
MTTHNQFRAIIRKYFATESVGRTIKQKAQAQRREFNVYNDLDAVFDALKAADDLRVACSVGNLAITQAAYAYDAKRTKIEIE